MMLTSHTNPDAIDWSCLGQCRFLIVVADYNRTITDHLLKGAQDRLHQRVDAHITVIHIAGALEIPAVIHQSFSLHPFDGYLALGCIIRGETIHFEIVANESARGLTLLGQKGALIANAILATETIEQAEFRAGPTQGNRGGEAADALLRLMLARRSLLGPGDMPGQTDNVSP